MTHFVLEPVRDVSNDENETRFEKCAVEQAEVYALYRVDDAPNEEPFYIGDLPAEVAAFLIAAAK